MLPSMKCRKCQERASINMRHHRLALCKEHYLAWFVEQTERFIEKYRMFTRQDRLLLAVSGGKDSLSLWGVLQRLNYPVDGLYIDLAIENEDHYSSESGRYAREFADERGLKLITTNIKEEYGESIPEMAQRSYRGRGRPCSVCGLVKRHLMNQAAVIGGYTVLVTAHNLDDEASFLMNNTMHWDTDLLKRQWPVLEAAPGFTRKAKPFCRFYERETAAYALLRGIEYIYDECPYAEGSTQIYYKEILNMIEEDHAGTKLAFYVGFLNARKSGLFVENDLPFEERYGNRCIKCGTPTTVPGQCAFCRLVSKNPSPRQRERS